MAKTLVIGAGAMGKPLIKRLLREHHEVAAVGSRSRPEFDLNVSNIPWVQVPRGPVDMKVFEPHLNGVEVVFLAIPSDGVGDIERDYMRYFLARGIYVVTFAKSALAYHFDALRDDLDMIGDSATVGGRTLVLPWLVSQRLQKKTFTMFAYVNASTNFFMDVVSRGESPEEAFQMAKDHHLAEPGSSDYVEFLNGEIGGDIPQKVTISMKRTVLQPGVYMTPGRFRYKALGKSDISELALPTKNYRYVVCISNTRTEPMFEPGKPGILFAKVDGFTISGGFHDISGVTHLNNWFKGGKANGVQIRFEGDYSVDGTVEIAGPGAGLGTVGAAMNDMYGFLERRVTFDDARRPFSEEPSAQSASA